MTRIFGRFGLALATVSLLGLALPTLALARDGYGNQVAFKAVVESTVDPAATYTLPSDPRAVSMKLIGEGEGEPLGAFTTVEQCLMTVDTYGEEVALEMKGVLTTPAGDALYYTAKGAVQGAEPAEFVITGGKGKYAGATGGGDLVATPGEVEGEWTWEFDGVVTTLP